MVTNGSSANGAGANGTGARHAHAHGASANGQAPSRTPLATALLLSPIRAGLERVEQRLRRTDDARANLHGVAVAAEAGATAFAPLSNAFLNLIDSGGKRLRPALALLAAQVGVPSEQAAAMAADERVIALAASVEMLHTSSLVHDDVIDGALLRRGAPTLNALWSGGSTVLAGNYMFGTAAQLAAATGHMGVIHLFSDTLNIIVNGELQQLRDRYNYDQPRDSYAQRIYAKTASLFCAATEGAALLAHLPEEQVAALRDYGYHLGMAFQVVDDILDFTGDEETLGKPAGSDLLQGTLTLPFFHYLQAHPQPEALIESLDRARDDGDEEHTAAWRAAVQSVVLDLRQSPAIDAARADAQQWLDAARTALAPFPASPARHAMFGLCDFVLQRTY
jgi:geranylgeranyl pyrophosphate synthase